MKANLSLRLKNRVIQKGKTFARKHKTSLSQIIENYLGNITKVDDLEITPLVKSLSGILKGRSGRQGEYEQYLKRKYK